MPKAGQAARLQLVKLELRAEGGFREAVSTCKW